MEAWAVCEHQKPLTKIQQDLPVLKGSEVLVEVTHCGVCHSDLHIWKGYYDLGGGNIFKVGDRGIKLPLALGHEVVGKVAMTGPDVKELDASTLKIVYPWFGCGECRRCVQGKDNLCAQQHQLGVMHHGGFASHIVVPHPRYLFELRGIDPAFACTFACSGITVYSAIQKVLPLENEDVIVLIGAGGLGLSAVNMLNALGFTNIFVLDLKDTNLEVAKKAGAKHIFNSAPADIHLDIIAQAGGKVLAAIDFVNNPTTASLAIKILAKGGKMVQVGVMGGELKLPLASFIFNAFSIQGNNTGDLEDLAAVIALAESGKLHTLPIERVSWEQCNNAVERLHQGKVTGRLVLEHDARAVPS